ncbi:hypothetical protein DTO046C5_1519 [Penicillium roqueforti]|nr:hypothetical protein DTO046C5_1519 [Penicillium roqueforti]
MADNNSPDYKALFLQAEKRHKEAEERQKQAEDEGRREKRRREQAEERTRPTTFVEFLRHSHNLLSQPLRVETPSRSTTGKIPLPTGKYCPTRLEHWTDCSAQQLELYKSVYSYIQLTPGGAPHLFSSLHEVEGLGRRLYRKPISSEQELEAYERFAVEEHVHNIITELCKLPAARDEFGLGDGIQFSNHMNSLNENEAIKADVSQPSNIHHPRPDQFCIHRVDDNSTTLLTSVEYKPPHKLSVTTLRMGLRPMDLWKDMVRSNKIPTDQEAKLRYNAERLVCSALVQEYHVMIQEGLEYSYVTNGIARVLLRVPHDDHSTLYYFLCDPNSEVSAEVEDSFQQPKTSVARTLCLCLMAFRSLARGQEWRNSRSFSKPFSTPIALFWSIQVQIPVRLMNRRHPHRILHNQQLVDCPLGLRPAVHRRVYSIGLSRRTHRAQIRTKQQAANGASAKLHHPHLSNEQVVNGTQGKIAMRNSAPNAVYSDYSLGVF